MNSKTWWGEKFIEALASFIDDRRLQRGKAYSRPSRLSKYNQTSNTVTAKIMGNKNPYFGIYNVPYYKTSIEFSNLEHPEQFLNSISNTPLVLAKLTARELPSTVVEILPKTKSDMTTKCSCHDWDNPCKHIAGLYFKIAEEIEHNPLLIFELRGITEELLSEKIKKYIQQQKIPQTDKKLPLTKKTTETSPRLFWGTPQIIRKKDAQPAMSCALIKKAGINPPFWHKKKPFIEVMENIYQVVKRSSYLKDLN